MASYGTSVPSASDTRFCLTRLLVRVSIWLNDTFLRLQSRWQPQVLIVGAGDLGELVLRSILRSRPAAYRPIGFLDPDPGTRNRTLHSVRVLGTPDDLAVVAGQHDIDLFVVALAPAYAAVTQRVRELCDTLGLPAFAAEFGA